MFLLRKKYLCGRFMARLRYILLFVCALFALSLSTGEEVKNESVVSTVYDMVASFEVSDDSEELDIVHRANSLFRTPQSLQSVESCRTIVSRGGDSMVQDARHTLSIPSSRVYAYGGVVASALMHIPCHILHQNFRL